MCDWFDTCLDIYEIIVSPMQYACVLLQIGYLQINYWINNEFIISK